MICDIAFVILWEIPERKAFRCLKTQYKHRWILFAEVIYATVKMHSRYPCQAILCVIFSFIVTIGTNVRPTLGPNVA